METARVISEVFGVGFEVVDFLKEWNLQSLNIKELEFTLETQKGWADPGLKVSGGESLDEARSRVCDGTRQTLSNLSVKVVFFVTHGTVMELVRAQISGCPASRDNVEKMPFLDYAEFGWGGGEGDQCQILPINTNTTNIQL
jgi:broad specificity phosphatase PhoE